MQHFQKQQFGTRLLALGLSAGLIMGSLTGCGNQGQDTGSSDTLAASTTSASAGVTNITTFPLPDGPEESSVYVEAIPDISDDFYRGMDASAVLALENSGVKYYNFDGEEQDVFMTLAQAGVNYIRLRVWNDPYDENGNGYGGGNNDVATAITLGQRATKYGMKVCIDFHYSDFWADPKKQFVPKAWEGMEIEEKADALYDFTLDSLTQLLEAGVDVGMVQIGNEINNGMSGETDVANIRKLLTAGSKAVREAAVNSGKEILVAVHYTNIDDMKKLDTLLTGLQVKEIDYDIVGLSFYPYWHGTMDDLKNAITHIRNTYGKKVYVAENAYCYTAEDGDGSANSVEGTDDLAEGYSASVQGQANEVRDVCAAASESGAEGIFYWEGTWIPVGPADADNSDLWEKYGGKVTDTEIRLVLQSKVDIQLWSRATQYANAGRILKYIKNQTDKREEKNPDRRIISQNDTAQAYRDYLQECEQLHLDLHDKEILFPKDLTAAHNRTMEQVKFERNKADQEKFQKAVEKLEKFAWSEGEFFIRPAREQMELTAEGKALHHCVGGYIKRMAEGETAIFFLRKANEPDKPFYTLELQKKRVIQCRTEHNASYDRNPDVKNFVDMWMEKVVKKGEKKKAKEAAA